MRQLPSLCWVCHTWPSQVICPDCVQRFAAPRARCALCALPLPMPLNPPLLAPLSASGPSSPEHAKLCLNCRQDNGPAGLDSCTACVDYAFPWASCVVDFKFHQAPAWARVLAALMHLNPLLEAQLARVDHVLPIPLSPKSLRQRGYNQALELARAVCPDRVRPHWLLKLRDTAAQSDLKGPERLTNLQGALAVEPLAHVHIRGARLLLIDDVMTTGSTLRKAAQLLRLNGAAEVHAAVFSRTPAPDDAPS